MKYKVCCEEINNKEVIIERGVWTGKTSLYINNKKLKGISKNKFAYKEDEDKEVEFIIKGNEFSGIELYVNNRPITILRRLNVL